MAMEWEKTEHTRYNWITRTVGRKTDDTERGEKGTEDAKTYKQDQDALKEMKKRRFEDIKQKKKANMAGRAKENEEGTT